MFGQYLFFSPVLILDVLFWIVSWIWSSLLKPRSSLKSLPRGTATRTHGAPRGSSATAPLLTTFGESTTVYEMMQAAIRTYPNRVAQKSRKFVRLERTEKVATKLFRDDQIQQVTYTEFGENISSFGSGLRALGLQPIPESDGDFDNLQGDFKMVLFEDTCPIWMTAMQGAFAQSMTVATCYATLGQDAVVSAVQETQATALLVNWKAVSAFAERHEEMPSLKVIIASTHELPENTLVDCSSSSLRIVTSDQVMEMGKQTAHTHTPPKPSDVAVIMYTSESTGMVTNVHLRPGKERFVSYLLLAHILALQVEHILLSVGATVCYSDPRELVEALPLFCPTNFGGVPKIYEILGKNLEKKIDQGPVAINLIYQTLLSWKMLVLGLGGDTPVSNVFFRKLSRKVFGGKLEFAVTGGGPISSDLHYFARACFNCPVIQGYALTETCVGGCFQALHDQRCQVVGPPVPCVEIMLQSEPDIKDSAGLPYLHTDTIGSKGERVLGRGEICLRGPSVSCGYFQNLEKTREEYDQEGFFHSGDIGQFTEDGVIQIIDRKKNLVKLKGGEYVALENMESAFAGSKYVTSVYLNELASNPRTRKEVIQSLIAEGKRAGLTKLELRILDVCLVTGEEWKPGKGLTASLKLDRQKIASIHRLAIQEMLTSNRK